MPVSYTSIDYLRSVSRTLGTYESPSTGTHVFVLICACVMTFGSYYIYDIPGILGAGISCATGTDIQCLESPSIEVEASRRFAIPREESRPDPLWSMVQLGSYRTFPIPNSVDPRWGQEIDFPSVDAMDTPLPFEIPKSDTAEFLSQEACMQLCFENPDNSGPYGRVWSYYGLLEGNRCFCGHDISTARVAPMNKCNIPCEGNTSESCGGRGYMTVGKSGCPTSPINTIQMAFLKAAKPYKTFHNNMLYSVYSYPNVILCVVGAWIIDKTGLRSSTLLFTSQILVGQIIFASGLYYLNYPAMLVGRIIFGLGGESLTVAQSIFCVRWFEHTGYVNLAFGITLGFSRFGSSIGFLLQPMILDYFGGIEGIDAACMWSGILFCFISWVSVVALCITDLVAERKGQLSRAAVDEEPVKLRDFAEFPITLWVFVFNVVLFYIPVFNFNLIGVNFFMYKWGQKYNINQAFAAMLVAVYVWVSAVGSPLIGYITKFTGRSLTWLLAGNAILICSHALMIFTTIHPFVAMVIMGIALSISGACLWPLVPTMVGTKLSATAYGLTFSLQNLGLATAPIIVSWLQGKGPQDIWTFMDPELFFLGCAIGATILIVILVLINIMKNGKLDASPSQQNKEEDPRLLRRSVNSGYGEGWD